MKCQVHKEGALRHLFPICRATSVVEERKRPRPWSTELLDLVVLTLPRVRWLRAASCLPKAKSESKIPGCSLQMPLDVQTGDPPKLELELHCDIVVIRPVIPSTSHPRLNRAFPARTAANAKPTSPLPTMEL